MKNFVSIFALIALFSCTNEPANNGQVTPPIVASTFSSLTNLIDELKVDPQRFSITDPTVASSITGEEGTIIRFGANSFKAPDGTTITSEVQVDLNEYLSLSNMLKNNIQTLSNGQLLVTGGSFELSATSPNNPVLTVEPWSVSAEIPVQTNLTGFENQMRLFTGERVVLDGREQVNWNFTQNLESWFNEGVMNFSGIDLGLSNCDALLQLAGENPTQFSVYFEGVTDPSTYAVWMFINDFPSVIGITSPTTDGAGVKTYNNSIPMGLNATLVVLGVDEDSYLKFGTLDINVQGDDVFTVSLDYGTTEMLTQVIIALGS